MLRNISLYPIRSFVKYIQTVTPIAMPQSQYICRCPVRTYNTVFCAFSPAPSLPFFDVCLRIFPFLHPLPDIHPVTHSTCIHALPFSNAKNIPVSSATPTSFCPSLLILSPYSNKQTPKKPKNQHTPNNHPTQLKYRYFIS